MIMQMATCMIVHVVSNGHSLRLNFAKACAVAMWENIPRSTDNATPILTQAVPHGIPTIPPVVATDNPALKSTYSERSAPMQPTVYRR